MANRQNLASPAEGHSHTAVSASSTVAATLAHPIASHLLKDRRDPAIEPRAAPRFARVANPAVIRASSGVGLAETCSRL